MQITLEGHGSRRHHPACRTQVFGDTAIRLID
jgi:hypothetical protein